MAGIAPVRNPDDSISIRCYRTMGYLVQIQYPASLM